MFTSQTSAIVNAVVISERDAIECALCLLSNGIAAQQIKANDREASQSLRGFFFQRLQSGQRRPELEAFRVRAYEAAEAEGMIVNRKSNSVGTLVSVACSLADRIDCDSIVRSASSLSEAVKLAKAIDKAAADAEAALKAEAAALEADIAAQAEAQAAADRQAAARELAIADGSYVAGLEAEIRAMIETYRNAGGQASFA